MEGPPIAGNMNPGKNAKVDPGKKQQMYDWVKNRREFVNRVIAGMYFQIIRN